MLSAPAVRQEVYADATADFESEKRWATLRSPGSVEPDLIEPKFVLAKVDEHLFQRQNRLRARFVTICVAI